MCSAEKKALVPRIRFVGFADAWEQRRLGELAHRVTRKNEKGESDLPLTISAQYGLVDQRAYFNNQVASHDMSGYYLLEKGEFAYNKSTSGDSPWGAVKRLTDYEKGCLSTLYICFGLDKADPDFLVTYYETDRWHREVQLIAAEGARNHGLLNIAPSDFFETKLMLPASNVEQRRIGALFSRFDDLIALHQRKCDGLKTVKKSLLEKMFPRDGETTPEVRFVGFADAWEQRRLRNIVTELATGKSVNSDDSISGQTNGHPAVFILKTSCVSNDMFEPTEKKRVVPSEVNLVACPVAAGSIVVSRMNTPERVGSCGYVQSSYPNTYLPDRLWRLRVDDRYDPRFVYFSLTLPKVRDKVRGMATGTSGSMHNVPQSSFLGLCLTMPQNEMERRAIGDFMSSLDDLIALHQRKLDALKNVKKSLLEGMFV